MPDLRPVIDFLQELIDMAKRQVEAVRQGDDDALLDLAQQRLDAQQSMSQYGLGFSECRTLPGQAEKVSRLFRQLLKIDECLMEMIEEALQVNSDQRIDLARYQNGMGGYTQVQNMQFPVQPRFFDRLS